MVYQNDNILGYKYYAQLEAIFIPDEDGEYAFGLTVYGTGKLYIDGELIVDNETHQNPGDSFFGAGTREDIGHVFLRAGYKVKICIDFGTAPTQSTTGLGTTSMGAGGFRVGCARIVDPDADIAAAVEVAKAADQVILCIGLNVSRCPGSIFETRADNYFS